MPRESARDKATRLLSEGRVIVTRADRDYIEAKVRGEGAIHSTGFLAGHWYCSCPSTGTNCSHVQSLKRISAPDLQPSPPLRRDEQDARIRSGNYDQGFDR
jgi:hypothetical protein